MSDKVIEGYFISFDPPQQQQVMDAVEQDGFTRDLDGLKGWILHNSTLEPQDPQTSTDRVIERLEQYLQSNPGKVLEAAVNVGTFVKNAFGGKPIRRSK